LSNPASKITPPTIKPPTPARLWLVRHGEVETRYHKTFGGRIDMNLSPRGHEQAVRLAGFLRGKKFDAVYASPMKRVQQTLAPFLSNGAPAQTIVPALREINFGDWTGLNWEVVCRQFNLDPHEWLDHPTAKTARNSAPASSRACAKSSSTTPVKPSAFFVTAA
jgi:broad specificity phosphatase PhoE